MNKTITSRCSSLSDLFKLEYCKHRILSPGYVISIECLMNTLGRFLKRPARIADLTTEFAVRFTSWRLTTKVSRATINKELRTLKALGRFAYRRKLLRKPIEVELIPMTHANPSSWTPGEISQILAAAALVHRGTHRAILLVTVVLICYGTGLRIIDVLNLKESDCDLAGGIIRVTEQKTGKRRAFRLDDQMRLAIERARVECPRNKKSERLIPYEYKTSLPAREWLKRALRAAGLPLTRRDLFQKIRRTTASLALDAGLNPTDVMGHSSKWVTDTFYINVDALKPMNVAGKLPRVSGNRRSPAFVASRTPQILRARPAPSSVVVATENDSRLPMAEVVV